MEINLKKDEAKVHMFLSGNLDTLGAPELQSSLGGLLLEGADLEFVLDLGSVSFVSSAGLRVLLMAMKKIDSAGGSMCLANMSDSVREVFDMTGFSAIFKISP
jgi:anti-anti-sigma factor